MARESGQYRQMLLERQERGRYGSFAGSGEDSEIPWFRIRFYVSLALFLCYVLLDYTGMKLHTLDSAGILAHIQKDMTEDFHVDTMLARMMDQIEITEEGSLPAEEGLIKGDGQTDGETLPAEGGQTDGEALPAEGGDTDGEALPAEGGDTDREALPEEGGTNGEATEAGAEPVNVSVQPAFGQETSPDMI